jgi:hypothetical protein
MFGLVRSVPRATKTRYQALQGDGVARSSPWWLKIPFFLTPPPNSLWKAERAPPNSNPYLLWTMASMWYPRPSLAASKLQSLLLSLRFLPLFLAWVWESVERERWTRERESECENEWVNWWLLCFGVSTNWTTVVVCGTKWLSKWHLTFLHGTILLDSPS